MSVAGKELVLREATEDDFEEIWPIFRDVAAAGDTYAYDRDIEKPEAFRQWMVIPDRTFVAGDRGRVLGTYYIKKNHSGPGSHVCNCGYMVSAAARGRGLATSMCEHSQVVAREMGFKAMQFNLVVATNEGAVRLWQKLGFDIVGTMPRAFEHPERGYVGAHVMFKWLADEAG